MAKRQREWARAKRAELIKTMGGKCVVCGRDSGLELDCINPRGDWHHRAEASRRIIFYMREWLLGNLQLLCEGCHNRKTARDRIAGKFRALAVVPGTKNDGA